MSIEKQLIIDQKGSVKHFDSDYSWIESPRNERKSNDIFAGSKGLVVDRNNTVRIIPMTLNKSVVINLSEQIRLSGSPTKAKDFNEKADSMIIYGNKDLPEIVETIAKDTRNEDIEELQKQYLPKKSQIEGESWIIKFLRKFV
jgi:hypothetical protein